MRFIRLFLFIAASLALPGTAWAQEGREFNLNTPGSTLAILALVFFIGAYLLVMVEEFTELRKSKPVILAAGIIWMLVAFAAAGRPDLPAEFAGEAFRHTFIEFAELFLFLLVAMTYINAMTERNIFEALRSWLVRRGFSYRAVFWVTGWLAFFISPMADNMTTALIMCAVVLAVGAGHARFISLSCINIVVAANAGGAYSPFGDITTLMVWQKGSINFFQFFWIFIPSLVNFAVPAAIMHFALPKGLPHPGTEAVRMKPGARHVIALFFITLVITVAGHQVLHLPPVYGMLTGLSFLGFFGFYLKRKEHRMDTGELGMVVPFDIFRRVAEAEWDTLLFFYGVLMCVGGLATFGQLTLISHTLYGGLGPTWANILIGLLSAVIDNIPVMYAVLTMHPDMHLGQWMLVTLTAGVGGSLLSIGSAAGVALMGQAKGIYTFFSHLRWSWAVALGYAASIIVHIWVNDHLFHIPA